MLSLIAATSINGVIGAHGKLPWHFSEDFKWFKKITMGSTLIVGRRTFESMGVLPGRKLIVLSWTKQTYENPSVSYANSLDQALSLAKESQPVFIIGGANLYEESLPKISSLYLTVIDKVYEGDAFFPKIPWNKFRIEYFKRVEEKGTRLSFMKAVRY
ncbi:MAG TPA: dihydrofolate reductase [Gammaproteobacteria bacterium]|nr:dihydrofolate reductase [Gammaproteobacteria bacterium]